ncbi:hypothetical protein [Peribacillus acanthi]|uniref:hypothetical protein n=1 Tax=Peribacillus acanthi TaxID=2171554 RepID=UPI000D3E708F|nr:hypothetical protein [Peribacillus acanthi]
MEQNNDKQIEFQLKWFDIVIGEYNSLRNESADSLKNQQSIINYGLTAIGVLIAFSANLWGKESIVEAIYVIFIPFMCNLIILIWNGEVRRMSRAGQYIKQIEDKIHNEISIRSNIMERSLNWETFLRAPKDVEIKEENQTRIKRIISSIEGFFSFIFQKEQEKNNKIKSNYIAIIIMFGTLSILSILLGIGHNFSMFEKDSLLNGTGLFEKWMTTKKWWLIIYCSLLVINYLFFVYHYRYFQKVKK